MKKLKKNRRSFVANAASAVAVASVASCKDKTESNDSAKNQSGVSTTPEEIVSNKDKKFMIVITGFGGASILDSFMALSETEVRAAGGNPSTLNCFADSQLVAVPDTPFKAVKIEQSIITLGGFNVSTDQSQFLRDHKNEMSVITCEHTSVNHEVAQRRTLTGNDAWSGKTIQEAFAETYGLGYDLPYMNMGSGAYALDGIDSNLQKYAKAVLVSNPLYFPLGLHSTSGLDINIDKNLLAQARKIRSESLDKNSDFYKTFRSSDRLLSWQAARAQKLQQFEKNKLYSKLFFSGKTNDPSIEQAKKIFPNYEWDSFDAQAITSFLAITRGVATATTIGPNASTITSKEGFKDFVNVPIAFDFSHNDHRATQAHMWARLLRVADGLIKLLKATPLDEASGTSYWDRTFIHFATEFGRSKLRPADSQSFGTAHDLNNGQLVISPMIKGNRILGGINPKDAQIYGFDATTGKPNPNKLMEEKELYSILSSMLDLDDKDSGLIDFRAIV